MHTYRMRWIRSRRRHSFKMLSGLREIDVGSLRNVQVLTLLLKNLICIRLSLNKNVKNYYVIMSNCINLNLKKIQYFIFLHFY